MDPLQLLLDDFSISALVASIIFSIWGMRLIRKAKREGHKPSLYFGLALLIFPYFIGDPYLVWGIGLALIYFDYRMQ